MIGNEQFEQLDRLLENPALIADRGFSEGVQRRINRPELPRGIVFVALAAVWLTLAALNWSPEFVATSLHSLLDITARMGSLVTEISSLSAESASPFLSSLPGVMVLLPAFGLVIVQLIDYLEI
jgi:hypothetical protein